MCNLTENRQDILIRIEQTTILMYKGLRRCATNRAIKNTIVKVEDMLSIITGDLIVCTFAEVEEIVKKVNIAIA